MTFVTIGLAACTMLVMALVFSYVLGWANTAFHVEVDPRINDIMDALPGANCGGCGFIGCGEYAEAIDIDADELSECLAEERFASEVESDARYAMDLGATGTPTFFINGIPLVGAQPIESFINVIESELDND